MGLDDAIYALKRLGECHPPDEARAVRGLEALHALLARQGDADLHEAAALLEVFLATGSIASGRESVERTKVLAEAVQRASAR